MTCRICLEPMRVSPRFAPCACKGSVGAHVVCLERWIAASGREHCEICGQKYLHVRLAPFENEEEDEEEERALLLLAARKTLGVVFVVFVALALG